MIVKCMNCDEKFDCARVGIDIFCSDKCKDEERLNEKDRRWGWMHEHYKH